MADTAGVVGQNPFEAKARLDSIANWKYVDKLDQLSTFSWVVPNDDYHRANAFVERNAFIPFLKPFRGFVTDFAVDKTEIDLVAEEFATHLKRRVFTTDTENRIIYTNENWFNSDWKFRAKFTVPKEKVVDEIKGFPLLCAVDAQTGFKNHAQANGDDFIFTQKDGVTIMPHELEKWDSSVGDFVAWIKVPKVVDSTDFVFFIYYGNPTVGNQEDIVNVWKENFKVELGNSIVTFSYNAVWHLHADSLDSTENNNDGTDTSITRVIGQIANAASFDAVNSKIDTGSGTTIDDIFDANGWISSWFNSNSDGEGNLGVIWQKGNTLFRVRDEAGGLVRLELVIDFDTTDGIWQTAVDIPINTNTRVDVVYDNSVVGNDPVIYINGTPRTIALGTLTETQTPVGTRVSDAASNFIIGNNTGQTSTFDGEIDEVRIMKITPADIDDIILTGYNQDFDNTNFLVLFPQEQFEKASNLIAQDILNSANLDQPSSVTWTLGPEFPTDIITVEFSKRNHWQALDEIALILGKDLFFDNKNHQVFIETKGHTFSKNEVLDIVITSKPEKATKNFANIINIVGKKTNVGTSLESQVSTATVLRNNYEVVVSDSQIGTSGQATAIANTLLSQMQKLTPSIKGRIPLTQFLRFNLQSGDIVPIAQPDKQLNGFFRVMEVIATKKVVKVGLESIETGVIRQRSASLTDTISTILDKLNDNTIGSS